MAYNPGCLLSDFDSEHTPPKVNMLTIFKAMNLYKELVVLMKAKQIQEHQ